MTTAIGVGLVLLGAIICTGPLPLQLQWVLDGVKDPRTGRRRGLGAAILLVWLLVLFTGVLLAMVAKGVWR